MSSQDCAFIHHRFWVSHSRISRREKSFPWIFRQQRWGEGKSLYARAHPFRQPIILDHKAFSHEGENRYFNPETCNRRLQCSQACRFSGPQLSLSLLPPPHSLQTIPNQRHHHHQAPPALVSDGRWNKFLENFLTICVDKHLKPRHMMQTFIRKCVSIIDT